MRVEFRQGLLGSGANGLEISITGYKTNPTDSRDCPSQVYIEEYDGVLQIHVWDGTSEDPQTIRIAQSV